MPAAARASGAIAAWVIVAGCATRLSTPPSDSATMTHAAMAPEARAAAGISDGLLRLSVGIEALEDLQADLDAALARVARCRHQREHAEA